MCAGRRCRRLGLHPGTYAVPGSLGSAHLQQLVSPGTSVAVVGDGKLGLLAAQLLALRGDLEVSFFGRHRRKLQLVRGCSQTELVDAGTAERHAQASWVLAAAWGVRRGGRHGRAAAAQGRHSPPTNHEA